MKNSWRGGERGAAYPPSEGVNGVSAARVTVHQLVHIRGAISTGAQRRGAAEASASKPPRPSTRLFPRTQEGGYRIQGRVCHPRKGVRGGSEWREGNAFPLLPEIDGAERSMGATLTRS